MLCKNVEERPSVKEILLNAYGQEKIEKLEKEKAEKQKMLAGQVRNYKKSMSYNRKMYSSKTSQAQSRKESRNNSKKKNFHKNNKPKIFIINNAKKPPRRNKPSQIVGNPLVDLSLIQI